MNRIYKVIFNTSLGLYQVVSEIARNHGKSSSGAKTGRKSVMVPFIVAALLALPVGTGALAADTGSSTDTQTNTAVTVKDGNQLQGTGAAVVSSTTTTTITINVPNDGKVESGNNGLVTGGTVYTALNDRIGTLSKDGTYTKAAASVSTNLTTLDTQVKTNADAISTEKTDREAAVTNVTNTVNSLSDSAVKYDSNTNKTKVTLAGEGGTTITNVKNGALSDSSTDAVTGKQLYAEQSARTAADTAITNKIGALSANGNYIQKDASVSSNLSTLDTQVKTNADAISKETTDRETAVSNEITARTKAISDLKTELTTGTNSSLASKANVNATNIDTEVWGKALGAGAIASGDVKLLSGGTLFTELRPSADGTYSYISSKNTTAVNLKSLDSAIAALGVEMLTDKDGNPIQYTSTLFKYFKVNPEFTTNNTDGTKTYAADAEANGTNSVAIGPNAKTAKYSTTTSGDTTNTAETAADQAVAIGDGATVNAAGDKGLAIGNGASVGEAESTTISGTTTTTTDAKGGESSAAIGDSAKANGKQALAFGKGASVLNPSGTAVSTGSTAIGSGAKVDGGDNSIALGTNAAVNTVSDAMALGNGAAINKTAAGSIAIGKAAATGGVDKPITLTNGTTGTLAAAGGVDSIAIGNGAVSEGNEALALGKGAKVTNGATGGDSAAAIVKTGSSAIGDGATVANSATSMAIGNGASIIEGENTTVIGSGAKASQTKQALVAGYQASADSNASGSIAIGDNASTHSEHTTAIGYKAEAHNADSIAIGSQAVTSDTGGGIAIGSNTSVAQGGIAVGKAAKAQNISSLAIGNGATANVNQSISIGYNAGVDTAEDEKEKNGSLVAIGTSAGNNVKGMQNVAIGASAGSSVLSSNNIAIGTNAGYGIKNVTSTTDTNPQNGYNISIGSGANYTEGNTNQNIVSSIAIGHNTHAVNRAVALGEGAAAKGDAGMALGNSASSDGADSIALGSTASAMDGNIALGAGSVAKGSPSGNARWTSQVAPEYYISVGNTGGGATDSPLLRRISNVADGSDDHDVATVAQLQKVADQLKDTITGTDSDDKDVKTYSTTYIDNEVTELKNDIASSKTKYFSVNPGSQTANADGTAANGDGDVDAMAIGPNAKASNVKALAIGNNVSASGTLSIAIGTANNPSIGTANNPSTDTTTADNPHPTSSEGVSSVAVGTSAIAQSDNSIAIGTRATTYTSNTTGTPVTNVGVQSIAIGYGAETRAENAISFGTTAKANSTDSVAVGYNAQALNERAIVIGSSTAYGSNSVTIGLGNTNNGAGVLTTGNSNEVTNSQGSTDVVKDSGIYGSSNKIHSVTTSNSGNAITDVSLVGNENELNQNGEMNVLNDVSVLGNNNTIENGTAGDYTQTVKQIAVVGSDNKVKGNTDINTTTWGTVQRDTILGYGNTVDATKQSTPVSNLQILGNNVTAALGNSVYLGNNAAYVQPNGPTQDAINAAKTKADTAAEASDEYKAAVTDEDKATIKAQYEAKYLYKLRVQAMEAKGTTAGMNSYDTDETYGNGTSYTYAGSNPAGVVTVGKAGEERRIQNVAAGLVSASSTDAVNGSQLYALTRQIRFGGDNSSFGKTTAAEDQNVVARGSNETISITGGSDAVTSSTTDGTTTYTVDAAKLTGNNIAVVADKDAKALHVQLASNLKDLNTASLGSGSGDSYKETIKLDGTGANGGQMTLAGADGTVKTTLDTTGLTIAGGPKFTSSGIDAASQKITSVKAGEADTDAANVGQVNAAAAAATTEVKAGTNASLGKVETNANDKHKIYTVNVDNLAVKANGTGNTTVALAKGINFVNGTNTTATVGADGTVTISASHNKLDSASYTASKPSDTSNQTTVKLKDTDGNESILNLTDTYTSVSRNTDHTITFKRNDGSTPVIISLDDLNGASKEALTTAAAKATTTVINGNNVDSVDDTTSADGHHIYKVNVSNLGVKVADGQKKSVTLSDGLVFGNGTNTTASVGDNGAITFNVSNEAIKTQAKDAINMTAGSNVKVETATSTDGLSKTFTISATHNTLKSAELTKGANDVSTLTITGNDGDTASVDIKNTYLTVSKDTANKTVTFTSNDGKTLATTLSLSDFGAASTTDMTAAVAKATTEVKAGTNATLGTLEMDPTDQHKIYTVNVENLGVSQNGTKVGTGVSLKDGLNFTDGTNTTASVAENGTVSYSVSNDAIKAQAKNAVMVAAGDNVSIDAPTDANNVKTYTVKVNDLKLQANGADKGTRKLAEGINFANGKNITAAVEDGKVVYSLNDALTDLTSVTAKDTTGNQTLVSGSGVTITPAVAGAQPVSLTTSGLSMGNQQITNVQSGGDTDTNAANISDVKRLVKESASGTTETGFNVKGDDATAQKVKLGKQLNVVGGTTDSTQLSTGNIGVETTADAEGNATLTVKLKKDIALDSVTTGSTTLNTSGVTNGNMSLTATGMTITNTDASKQVSVTTSGVSMGGNVIHNVGNGVDPTDAVNKGQLEALQTQVSGGWNLTGKSSDGTAVTAKIGAGKTVTYGDGNYTKSVVTKDDSTGNATVKVDVTTGTFGSGTGDKAGTVTATVNGLATTQDVADAINKAAINVVADNTPDNKTAVKDGNTIHFAKDGNLTLTQNGPTFTYGLNKEISISKVTTSDTTKGSTVQTAEGVTTTDAAGNTYIQNGQGITLTPSDKTKSPVKLTNGGLDNGGNKITGVGKGTDDTDAVNVAQLKEVNNKVGSGWQLADNNGTKVADIGAGRKVSFKTDSQYLTAKTESAGTDAADVTYGLKTKALEAASGKVSSVDTAEDGLATAKNVADTINQTYWTAASGKSGSGRQTDETTNAADKQISAGDTVTFNAGNNLSLIQNGASFTYGLQADLTSMNTIAFTPRTDDKGHPISLVIGKQKDGVSTDEGYYITGLDNTTWNQSNYVKDRAATEAQLADAIKQVTLASQSGGFKLSDDHNQEVSQVLGKAIGVVGDGNITTTAETTTADPNGHIKVSLNKNIDLGTDGSLQAGGVTLNKNSVTVGNDGIVISSSDSERTVSNLSNTTWDTAKVNQEASAGGYKGSTKAATESQLAEAISTATSTASANEQHIKDGSYSVTTIDNGDGTKSQGVSIDIVTGDGSKPEDVKGKVVIKDVAKASEVGTVSEIADDLKKKNGDTVQPTSVVEAINNLNDKVGDKKYSTVQGKEITDGDNTTTAIGKLNNRMNDIYQTAGQHTTVSNTDKNLDIKPTTDDKGKTNYEINLSKQVNLGDVKLDGEKGSIEAKSVKADSFTSGSTVVNNDGVQVGKGTALTSDSLKVGNKTYISSDGLNANNQKITNVQTGIVDTDAANVGQVRAADEQLAGGIEQNAAHISQLGQAVNKLDNRINRVGAGAAALAALHPGDYDPDDKLDVSAGVGNYRGANAAAVGLFFHPNERTILSVAGSMGGGENMVNAGVTLKVGPGHGTPTTVTTKTGQKVDVMDILAKQTEILEKLAGNTKAASAPAGSDIFPDVPQNHWAYAYVDKLYRAGSLAGFSEPGKLKSHMLTRKDFAEILYWAMTNGATTNPDLNGDGSLNRLAAEFGAELKLVVK